MIALSVSAYLPLAELAKIVAAVLVVAVAAPSAAALAAAGLDRRRAGALAEGTTLVALGAAALTLLVTAGLYALVHR